MGKPRHLDLILMSGFIAGCAPAADVLRAGTGGPQLPPAPLPPLESMGTHPYIALDFTTRPPENEAGRWESIVVAPQPQLPPTPTPRPTPTLLPGESPEYSIFFPERDAVMRVGESRQLAAMSDAGAAPGTATWGVLEAERARISQDGLLTTVAPGPIHVYAEIGGRRRYLLVASIDPGLDARAVEPRLHWNDNDQWQSWGTFIRSPQDWADFKARFASDLGSQAAFTQVDFNRETVVVIYMPTTDDREQSPVLTRIRTDRGTVVEAVAADVPPGACACDARSEVSVVVVPLLPQDAQLELVRLHSLERLATLPATGPTPTPAPSPTPTPDPFYTTPPDTPPFPEAPPYMPPWPSQVGGCPDGGLFKDGHIPPFQFSWLEVPPPGPGTWEPVLTPGGTMRLFARSDEAAVNWETSDARIASIDEGGTVSGHHAGVTMLKAVAGAHELQALIPVVDASQPALRFRFRRDWSTPNDQAVRGPRIIRDPAAWALLWANDLYYSLKWAPPKVDFTKYDIVALVDDRSTYAESEPVITQITEDATRVHIVFPGIQSNGAGAYHRATFLFLTGKLSPDATVRVHTLCDP